MEEVYPNDLNSWFSTTSALLLKMFVLARPLPLGNGHSLRTKILRSLLVKFPTFQVVWVWRSRKNQKILESLNLSRFLTKR